DLVVGCVPALGANVRVVIVSYARKHVVGRAAFAVEIDGPVTGRPCFEAAKNGVSVVLVDITRRTARIAGSRSIGTEIESFKAFFNTAMAVTVAKVDRIMRAKLVIALDDVLILAIRDIGVCVQVTKADCVSLRCRSVWTCEREEV